MDNPMGDIEDEYLLTDPYPEDYKIIPRTTLRIPMPAGAKPLRRAPSDNEPAAEAKPVR